MNDELPIGWKRITAKSRRGWKSSKCIYCSLHCGGENKEHLPARNLFYGVRRDICNTITVPCHKKCNESRSNDDEWLRNIVVSYCADKSAIAKNILTEKVVRSAKKIHKTKYDVNEKVLDKTPSGIIYTREVRHIFSPEERGCMLRVVHRIVLALYWTHLDGYAFNYRLNLFEAKDINNEFMNALEIANWAGSGNPDVFKYKAVAVGEDQKFLLFQIVFYNSLPVIGLLSNDDIQITSRAAPSDGVRTEALPTVRTH